MSPLRETRALAGIDPQAADLDRPLVVVVRPRHPGAPQRRLHARAELAHRERLGDVVVRAELEPEDLVDLLGLRGEHDDRHRLALGAQAPADLEAVHPRQHHVEHDEIEDLLVEARERLAAVGRLDHLVAVPLQREGEKGLDRLLVVDEQDSGGAVCHDLNNAEDSCVLTLTSDLVLDARVYRTAFLPALVALFLAAFALEDRPDPGRSTLAPDVFSGQRAFDSLQEMDDAFPDRSPGCAGDAGLADQVASELAAPDEASERPAFTVQRSTAPSRTGDLQTVIATRTGFSSRRIVVLADRDAPGLAGLSGTAALLELGRVFKTRDLDKTLVLVSTTGATTGFAGARAWAREEDGDVDGVIVLGDMAGEAIRKPWVVSWPASSHPLPLGLERTVQAAVRRETRSDAGRPARGRPVDPARAAGDGLGAGPDRRRGPARGDDLGVR